MDTWVQRFRELSVSIKRMYEMCGQENLAAFTEGVIDTLQHSLDEFRLLRESQTTPSQMDIQDGEGTLDEELLRQLVDEEHMQPATALVLMVRERAEMAEDLFEEDLEEESKEKRSYSYSPRRVEALYTIKEKLEVQNPELNEAQAAQSRPQLRSSRVPPPGRRGQKSLTSPGTQGTAAKHS